MRFTIIERIGGALCLCSADRIRGARDSIKVASRSLIQYDGRPYVLLDLNISLWRSSFSSASFGSRCLHRFVFLRQYPHVSSFPSWSERFMQKRLFGITICTINIYYIKRAILLRSHPSFITSITYIVSFRHFILNNLISSKYHIRFNAFYYTVAYDIEPLLSNPMPITFHPHRVQSSLRFHPSWRFYYIPESRKLITLNTIP